MINKLFKNKIILIFILIIAFILRFYRLGEIPLSLDWDEVSNAYNAYSILKTTRDEYGVRFPLTNRSFDDYKPPLYMYLNIPTVAIFGLTSIAARLPSAIFGFLTVPMFYLLAKYIYKNELIAQLSALLLAIAPWHIQFSRVGFEANLGLFTTICAVVFFLYGLKNTKLLILSAIFIGLSFYSYHSERIFVPLLMASLVIIYRKELIKFSRKTIISLLILIFLIGIPLLIFSKPQLILQRFITTTSESNRQDVEKSIKLIKEDQIRHFPLGTIIHNRRLIIAQYYFSNYLSNLDFNFLFVTGDDNFRHHIEDMGMLYFFELPLFVFGLYSIIRNKSKESMVIILWLLFAPIAAAPANPNPHALRVFPMIVPLELISAYSLYKLFTHRNRIKILVAPIYALWIASSFIIYLHNYWSHYPSEKASFWQYGYKEAVFDASNYSSNQKIIVDHSIEQGYIYFLFYTHYDPSQYQQNGSREHFSKYYFTDQKPTNPSDIFIAEAGRFPTNFQVDKIIYYPDMTPAIKIGHL